MHKGLQSLNAELTTANNQLREQLAAVLLTSVNATITLDMSGIIQAVNPATEQMFGYTAAELIGQTVKILLPSLYRQACDHPACDHPAIQAATGAKKSVYIGTETVAQRKCGSTFPVDLALSALDHHQLFTVILRDITRSKELEREVVEIASLEQRRIGQDLHDSVGQELTALNILADDLAETLRTDPASGPKLLKRIVEGLRRSQQELREVMRGLLPVAVDTEGLMAALSDLADRTREQANVACEFVCPEPVFVANNLTATHLYLVAQEAVHNAVKHAQPRNIRISLESKDLLVLRVQDDGVGMPLRSTEIVGGMGLRIMQNRATVIGAALTIQSAEPTGILVTCTLVRKKHETQ